MCVHRYVSNVSFLELFVSMVENWRIVSYEDSIEVNSRKFNVLSYRMNIYNGNVQSQYIEIEVQLIDDDVRFSLRFKS
jgi:hypothetical protein